MTGGARNTPVAAHFGRLARRHSSVNNSKSIRTCIDCGAPTNGQRCRACASIVQHKKLRLMDTGFWERIDQSGGPDACWEWQGIRSQGYGVCWRTTDHGLFQKSHRFAWYLTHGPIPEGLFVCHACDNPPCCNPAHLFLGTIQDNNRDKMIKGRQPRVTGEANPSSRLSDDDVSEIRRLRAAGVSRRVVAAQFGIKAGSVTQITIGNSRADDGVWPEPSSGPRRRNLAEEKWRTKHCAECGQEFVPRSSNARYCGDECRRVAWNRMERASWQKRRAA